MMKLEPYCNLNKSCDCKFDKVPCYKVIILFYIFLIIQFFGFSKVPSTIHDIYHIIPIISAP